MSRRPTVPARGLPYVGAALAALLAVPAAFAQEATPTPVVDRWPARVPFTAGAVVRGHLENGVPGDEVAIQKATAAGTWKVLRTKPVDEENKDRFRLRNRRTTSKYRLAWTEDATGMEKWSDEITIRVRPKLTLRTRPRHPFSGAKVRVKGALRPARGGRTVVVQRRAGGKWRTVGRAPVRDGRYRAAFKSGKPGRVKVRAVFRGDEKNTKRTRSRRVKVYDPDLATWYGPGFYGNRTACGRTLREGTHGVAHRTLPCGTEVSIVYRGRTITVPVIDRGPYTSATWDLTGATARRLGFSGRDVIGTVH